MLTFDTTGLRAERVNDKEPEEIRFDDEYIEERKELKIAEILDRLKRGNDQISVKELLPKSSYIDFCENCQRFQEGSNVCKFLSFNVGDYPTKFEKKCDGKYFTPK